MAVVRHKEAIHSGHFMISEFEDEDQDEDEVAAGVPGDEGASKGALEVQPTSSAAVGIRGNRPTMRQPRAGGIKRLLNGVPLKKLFHAMSIIYRQKITSPKWNSFRGLRLGWDDKIRLNNVIWRCWHQQFGKYDCKLIFTFANPLDIDYHNGTEGSTVLEGKYWKRKIDAIKYEYKKWRRFYCHTHQDVRVTQEVAKLVEIDKDWEQLLERQIFLKSERSKDDGALENIPSETDLMLELLLSGGTDGLETDFLLNGSEDFFTGGNHGAGGNQGNIMSSGLWGAVVPFPNPKDSFYKNTVNADFIQPGLNQLQPSFEDFGIDFDFTDIFNVKTNNPEEVDNIGRSKLAPLGTIPQPQLQQHELELHQQQQMQQPFDEQQLQQEIQQQQLQQIHLQQGQQGQMIQHQQLQLQQQFVIQQNTQQSNFPQLESNPNSVKSIPDRLNFITPDTAVVRPQPRYPLSTPSLDNSETRTKVGNQQRNEFQDQGQYFTTDGSSLNFHKLRSPKHRVLQQREHVLYNSTVNNFMSSSPRSPQPPTISPRILSSNNVQQLRPAPYILPQIMGSNRSAPSTSEPQHPASELRQLLKSTAPATLSNSKLDARPIEINSVRFDNHERNTLQSSHKLSFAIPPPTCNDVPQSQAESVFSSRGAEENRQKQSFRGQTHTQEYQDHRRNVHVNAEQNRRHSIKYGFEALRSLVPALSNAPASMKTSKAALLMKGGDYLQQLKVERDRLAEEIARNKHFIEELKQQLEDIISFLPTGGSSPNNSKRNQHSSEGILDSKFELHVRCCTEINWKFWIFSKLVAPLFESYKKAISDGTIDEMNRSAMTWLDNNCSPLQMRHTAISTLRNLSLSTDILVTPQNLPREALLAVRKFDSVTNHRLHKKHDMSGCS